MHIVYLPPILNVETKLRLLSSKFLTNISSLIFESASKWLIFHSPNLFCYKIY